MDHVAGTPYALKQVNLSVVRKAIKENGSATRAELVAATKISVTTVRTLLREMLENREIIEVGYDESIGGRKAVRYELQKDRFFGVSLCLGERSVRYLLVDICGEIRERGEFAAGEAVSEALCSFLDELFAKKEIRAVGIGVPGVVDGLCYQRKNAAGIFENNPIGERIHRRYGVPVVLENDLNAIALGFGRCYLREFPEVRCENLNMAYVHFGSGCLGAGFLSGGSVLRGWQNFVGELGLFPVTRSQTMNALLASAPTDTQYAKIVAQLLAGLCCVLNPQYIAIGGACFRKDCLPAIIKCFDSMLPEKMTAEILYAQDKWHDYFDGMAHLTAEQIFSNILLIKE